MSSRNVPADFKCPNCSAHYKVVRVKTEPKSSNRLVHCIVCKEPLASMAKISSNTFSQPDRARFAVERGQMDTVLDHRCLNRT